MEAKLVLNAGATLGEGPAWDHRHQYLIWVDIEEKQLHIYRPAFNLDESYQLDQRVGAAVPMRTEGRLLLALADGLAIYSLKSKTLTYVAETEREQTDNRFILLYMEYWNAGKMEYWEGQEQ
jgi:sugar lactone lactonase YvrE